MTCASALRAWPARRLHGRVVLPFGIEVLDRVLPGGGLPLGALHEVAGGGNGAIDGAAAALFAAGIAARTKGKVLWCVTRPGPVRSRIGAGRPRCPAASSMSKRATTSRCSPVSRKGCGMAGSAPSSPKSPALSMTASRRLATRGRRHPASIGIALRRWRRQTEAADFGQPTAAVTRWRVSVLPSTPLPVPGVGRASLACSN